MCVFGWVCVSTLCALIPIDSFQCWRSLNFIHNFISSEIHSITFHSIPFLEYHLHLNFVQWTSKSWGIFFNYFSVTARERKTTLGNLFVFWFRRGKLLPTIFSWHASVTKLSKFTIASHEPIVRSNHQKRADTCLFSSLNAWRRFICSIYNNL